MPYAAYLLDAPHSDVPRNRYLAEHLSFVEQNMSNILVAGPLKDSSGSTIGSLYVIKAETLDDAEAFLRQDPYYSAGVWQPGQLVDFSAVAGDWVGGKNW